MKAGTPAGDAASANVRNNTAGTSPPRQKMKKRDRTGMLVRAVGCILMKPISEGDTWDFAGDTLRDYQDFAFRAMNTALQDCLVSDRVFAIQQAAPGADSEAKAVAPASLAYRSVNRFLEEHRAYWVKRSAKEWKDDDQGHKARVESRIARRASLNVPSCICVALSKLAADKYVVWRKTSARGEMTLPSIKANQPIVWSTGWSLEKEPQGYALSLKVCRTGAVCITKGRCMCAPLRFALRVDGGSAHKQFKLMTDPKAESEGIRLGNVQVFYEARKRDWQVRITYESPRPAPIPLSKDRLLVVHRGMREFLTLCVVDQADVWMETADSLPTMKWALSRGTGLSEYIRSVKDQFHRRRKGLQEKKRALGGGKKGRGTWTRTSTYRQLEDTEARFVDTVCKQVASAVVKLAIQKGCGRIVMDDWSARQAAWLADRRGNAHLAMAVRRWPFAQQRTAIQWAADKIGLEFTAVDGRYESTTCPRCNHVDPASDRGSGRFLCTNDQCALAYGIDAVAAWNMAKAAGVPGAFELYDAKLQAAVKKMTAAGEKAA